MSGRARHEHRLCVANPRLTMPAGEEIDQSDIEIIHQRLPAGLELVSIVPWANSRFCM